MVSYDLVVSVIIYESFLVLYEANSVKSNVLAAITTVIILHVILATYLYKAFNYTEKSKPE